MRGINRLNSSDSFVLISSFALEWMKAKEAGVDVSMHSALFSNFSFKKYSLPPFNAKAE